MQRCVLKWYENIALLIDDINFVVCIKTEQFLREWQQNATLLFCVCPSSILLQNIN
ncbi:hypothetical protein FDUTEX481_07267 [Tolypothrix sp. PCC 7601]|nr:hypothetical protein FDUTEX481_07267 [Tolypothrix sp. PCC 7601]